MFRRVGGRHPFPAQAPWFDRLLTATLILFLASLGGIGCADPVPGWPRMGPLAAVMAGAFLWTLERLEG